MKRHRIVVVVLVVLAIGTYNWAFRGHEHADLGNDALSMVVAYLKANERYWCNETRKDRCLDETDLLSLETLLPDGERITYGDIVAAVDHVVNPIKFIEREGLVACYPGDASELYAEHVTGQSQLLAWRASHVNEMHFQNEGMSSFWYWHDSAINAGVLGECLPLPDLDLDDVPDSEQDVDTLVGALVVNAIGDHFLHDHYAPGHIYTFRDTLGDYSSLSNHDRYNSLGAVYLVNKARWQAELKPLMTAEGIDSQLHLDAESVEAAIADIESGYTLELWGDDNLWRNNSQRLFQILLGARSILDVVDAYVSGKSSNHFGHYTWEQMKIVDKKLQLPRAGITYGEYAPHLRKNNNLPRGAVVHLGLSGQGFVEVDDESAFTGLTELEFSNGFAAPGRQSKSGELDPRIYSWDLAVGYAYLKGSDFYSYGPTGRVIFNIPKINMRFSADLASRRLKATGVSETELAYGVRWELGFALAAMHFGVGSDSFVNRLGAIERSPTVRYGITFSLPTTRIPLVQRAAKARLRRKRDKWLSKFTIPETHLASVQNDSKESL